MPKTNMGPESRPSRKEHCIPTIYFQVPCWFQGGYHVFSTVKGLRQAGSRYYINIHVYQVMLNWSFGARWFGLLGFPYEKDLLLRGIPRIPNPPTQRTI